MKPATRSLVYFLCGLMIGVTLITAIALRKKDASTIPVEISAEGRPQYKWYPPQLPSAIDFCGEAVPLDKWEVREKLDRELLVNSYLHGSQLYILKLAG